MKFYCLNLSGYGATPLKTRKNKSEVETILRKYGVSSASIRRIREYSEGKDWHTAVFGA